MFLSEIISRNEIWQASSSLNTESLQKIWSFIFPELWRSLNLAFQVCEFYSGIFSSSPPWGVFGEKRSTNGKILNFRRWDREEEGHVRLDRLAIGPTLHVLNEMPRSLGINLYRLKCPKDRGLSFLWMRKVGRPDLKRVRWLGLYQGYATRGPWTCFLRLGNA